MFGDKFHFIEAKKISYMKRKEKENRQERRYRVTIVSGVKKNGETKVSTLVCMIG